MFVNFKQGLPSARGGQPRSSSLDGIRGLAILAVMANHTGIPLARGGYLGVDMFFVLSGYLITTLLVREQQLYGRISLGRFYLRRGLRLYPALILTCLAVIIVPTWVGFDDRTHAVRGAAVAATYLQDISLNFGWPGDIGSGLNHTWTLAIEEQFYLIWPAALLIMLVTLRLRRRWVAAVLVAGIVYSLAVLTVNFKESASPTSVVYYRPDARAGALLVGCLLAIILQQLTPKLPRPVGWAALILFVGTCAAAPEANTRSAFAVAIPLTWASSALVVAELVTHTERRLSKILGWRPLAWVGLVSYGLYLYHPLINRAIAGHTSLSRHEGAPAAILVSMLAAFISYRFLEMPFLRLKHRFELVGSVTSDGAPSTGISEVAAGSCQPKLVDSTILAQAPSISPAPFRNES